MRRLLNVGMIGCLSFFLGACQYLISPAHAPAALISAYELSHKRERWEKFAEQGDVYAQFNLAESYRNGMLEGDIDGAKAMRWYCEAARNGYVNAQIMLAKLYEQAETIQRYPIIKDHARAYMWYRLATNRVSEEARQRLETLESMLTPQEARDGRYLMQNPMKVPCDVNPLPWVEANPS